MATASNDVDVFQDGDDVFLLDASVGSIERIDPSFTTLTQRIDVPLGSRVAYGGDVLAILSPKGQLWTTPAGGDLSFDAARHRPDRRARRRRAGRRERPGHGVRDLRRRRRARAHRRGRRRARRHAAAEARRAPAGRGRRASRGLRRGSRRRRRRRARRGAARGGPASCSSRAPSTTSAYVAGASELMAVPLGGGDARAIESDAAAAPARAADEVAAPVWVDGCAHAAWATSSTYLAACDGREPSLAVDRRSPRRARGSSSASIATSSC